MFRYNRHHLLGSFIVLSGLMLGGCQDPSPEDEPPAKQNSTVTQIPKTEPVKKNLRVIGEGEIAAPKIAVDEVERLTPTETADEKNAAQAALKKIVPTVFPRPLALSANTLKSGDTLITLKHIFGPSLVEKCSSSKGDWPCGNFAKSAFQRLIRARSVSCIGEETATNAFSGDCKIANTDLATWLVEQGWAKTEHNELIDLMEKAKQAKKGIWRE